MPNIIIGVTNEETYYENVEPEIIEENIDKIVLQKDGIIVPNYESGSKIYEIGNYILTASDKVGNTTTVNFSIKYARSDLNENSQIDIGDLLLLLRHMAQASSEKVQNKHPQWKLSNQKKEVGDLNKNGTIDIGDVLKVRRYMAAKASQKVADKHPDWLNIE